MQSSKGTQFKARTSDANFGDMSELPARMASISLRKESGWRGSRKRWVTRWCFDASTERNCAMHRSLTPSYGELADSSQSQAILQPRSEDTLHNKSSVLSLSLRHTWLLMAAIPRVGAGLARTGLCSDTVSAGNLPLKSGGVKL